MSANHKVRERTIFLKNNNNKTHKNQNQRTNNNDSVFLLLCFPFVCFLALLMLYSEITTWSLRAIFTARSLKGTPRKYFHLPDSDACSWYVCDRSTFLLEIWTAQGSAMLVSSLPPRTQTQTAKHKMAAFTLRTSVFDKPHRIKKQNKKTTCDCLKTNKQTTTKNKQKPRMLLHSVSPLSDQSGLSPLHLYSEA